MVPCHPLMKSTDQTTTDWDFRDRVHTWTTCHFRHESSSPTTPLLTCISGRKRLVYTQFPLPPYLLNHPPTPVPTSTPHQSLSGSIEQRWQILFWRFQVGQRTIRIWGLWVGNILKMKMKSLNKAIKRVKQSRAFFSNLAPFLKIWMTFTEGNRTKCSRT